MVKLADRISNLQAPPHYWNQDKIIRYREEGIQIYEALKDASLFLASHLATKIQDYKAFIKVNTYIRGGDRRLLGSSTM